MDEHFVDKDVCKHTKILDTKNPVRMLRVLVTLFLTVPTMMFSVSLLVLQVHIVHGAYIIQKLQLYKCIKKNFTISFLGDIKTKCCKIEWNT